MKEFIYTNNAILSFTADGIDYVIFGKGPHKLPENSPMVESLVMQKILTEVLPPKTKK